MFLLDDLLTEADTSQATDLYLKEGRPPLLRLSGRIVPTERDPVEGPQILEAISKFLSQKKQVELEQKGQIDFAYTVEGRARFRMNAFRTQGLWNLVCRRIPLKIPSLDDLGLPSVLKDVLAKTQGMVLVTGPTGSGKSTTLAAMVDYINHHRQCHILTVEDPVEYIYDDKMAIVHQREIGSDVETFTEALRGALRQDPDVLLIGEMRDQDSMGMALTAAETGHLVLSTLHTNDATQTVERIVDLFPGAMAKQIRLRLSLMLLAIFSQRLVAKSDGQGRSAVVEVMVNSPTIQNLLQEGHTQDMRKCIADSADVYRMQTLNQALARKVEEGEVRKEEALRVSPNPKELSMMVKGRQSATTLGSVSFQDGEFV